MISGEIRSHWSSLAGGAAVILLDEPTAGMSQSETEKAIALIQRATAEKTLLIVEHDMGVVFGLADRISVLVYGQIIATGTPEEIRRDPKVRGKRISTRILLPEVASHDETSSNRFDTVVGRSSCVLRKVPNWRLSGFHLIWVTTRIRHVESSSRTARVQMS